MGLNDAIREARRQRELRQAHDEQEKARAREEHRRFAALLKDAVGRLRSHRRETLHLMRRSEQGEYRDRDGRRYQQIAAYWCWVVKTRRHEVLLLVTDTEGAVNCAWVVPDVPSAAPERYLTASDPTPVAAGDYVHDVGAFAFTGAWIEHLEKDLAGAILRYTEGE